MDRKELFIQEGSRSDKKKDHIPLVVTFHPGLNELRDIVNRFHTRLEASEEHRRVFKEKTLVAFRRAGWVEKKMRQ